MSERNGGGGNKGGKSEQRGGFVLGLIVGLLLGLAVALGVALYITKTPVPFINKVPQRTAEQDAEEAARNKNWDPNAPLASKSGMKAASGVVGGAPTPADAPAPVTATPAPPPADTTAPAVPPAAKAADSSKPADKKADAAKALAAASAAMSGGGDPYTYFVQAGAYTQDTDAEQQRAKLAMLGFTAKVLEREQSGRTVYRVRMGPLDGREEAEDLQRKVEAAGVEANLVRVQRQ